MRTRTLIGALAVTAAALLVTPLEAEAQIPRRLKDAAKRAVESEMEAQVDRLIREAIRCAINDPTCYRDAQEDGGEVIFTDDQGDIIVDDDGVPITDRDEAAEQAGWDLSQEDESSDPGASDMARPGEGVWANYDFVPGETVLYYEDYENDRVGDFPRRMEFMRGNWEIVEWEGRRLLRNTGPRHAAVKIVLPRELPESFTIELEAYFTHGNHQMILTTDPPDGENWASLKGHFFRLSIAHGTGVDSRDRNAPNSKNRTDELLEGLVPIRIMVDDRYAKVYVGERRVANIPNAEFARTSELYLENIYSGSLENPLYFGPIRVAEGGRDLYDKLTEDGRVATRGILFAFNSSAIRPESTPTLDEIGTMLQDHPDLRIRIEGHTDSTGDDDYNQTLSEERAHAVLQFLVDEYGLDPSRLEAQGFGESAPVDTNDTPEGQQNNRRVELVRLDT
jgi:outer membrane protein OmpA-like peptidoglycan-associated protein